MTKQEGYHTNYVRWEHQFAGRPATVYTDTFDGYERGKPTFTEDTTGTECTIRLDLPRARARRDEDETGFDLDNDAVIIFDPAEVTIHGGIEDDQRASIIHDHRTDNRYRCIRVRDEGGPLRYADCEDMRNTQPDLDS